MTSKQRHAVEQLKTAINEGRVGAGHYFITTFEKGEDMYNGTPTPCCAAGHLAWHLGTEEQRETLSYIEWNDLADSLSDEFPTLISANDAGKFTAVLDIINTHWGTDPKETTP